MPWIRVEEGSLSPEEERALRASPDWLGPGLVAVLGGGLLALIATWLVAFYLPTPDEWSIHVGLIGFFFVVFFDLIVICFISQSKMRKGQHGDAIKWSARWALIGLLVAVVVGSLPWLLERLIQAVPWLIDALSIAGRCLILVVLLGVLWRMWRVRKASP